MWYIAVQCVQLSAGEADGSITATITRASGSSGAVSVTVETMDISAAAPEDYIALSEMVSFADGYAPAKSVAISGNGLAFAVAAQREDSAATGNDGDESDNSVTGSGHFLEGTGAVYVFHLDNGSWLQISYAKASNSDLTSTNFGRWLEFGTSLAISADGAVMAMGGPLDTSDAQGIGGDKANENANHSGAVCLY